MHVHGPWAGTAGSACLQVGLQGASQEKDLTYPEGSQVRRKVDWRGLGSGLQ